jgi:hypothetical protein
MTYSDHTISIETVLGDNDEFDNSFYAYLDEYSIHYAVGDIGDSGYPVVEYTGGPIALCNMLKERFGLEQQEIQELYPNIHGEK